MSIKFQPGWRDTVLMRFMTLQMAISFLAKSICADRVAV